MPLCNNHTVIVHMLIDAAREALESERRKVLAERDAFREFEERLADITADQSTVTRGGKATQLFEEPQTTGVGAVRDAYEATLMSVEHFESDYRETYREHVAAELGAEYAEVLRTESRLTPQLKQRLLLAAADARRRRTGFAEVLDEEAALLDRVETFLLEVRPIPEPSDCESFDELRETAEQLQEYDREAESLLGERQDHLHGSSSGVTRSNRICPKSLGRYLYGSLETMFPVLHLLTTLLADIRDAHEATAARVANFHGRTGCD